MTRQIVFICLIEALFLIACNPEPSIRINKETVTKEVQLMLDNYHNDIKTGGLTAEFRYLDQSEDFFWVPPGYKSALTYDSVKTILENNAPSFAHIEFHWDTLQIFPLSNELANYTGIVGGFMINTSGDSMTVSIIESGTIIKRQDGWKLLSGQSANLK